MMPMGTSPIFILGGGALGLRLALHCKAAKPVLVLKEGQAGSVVVRSVDHSGAQIDEAEIQSRPLSSITEFPSASVLFLCMKVYALREVLESLKPRLLGTETVVLCQNGLGVAEMAAEVIGAEHLVRLLARFGALRISPGIIRPSGPAAVTVAPFEEYPASIGRAETVTAFLRELGVEVSGAASPIAAEWHKTAVNIITNSIATILNGPNGTVLDEPEVWKIALAVLEECRAVAQSDGVALGQEFFPDELRAQIERYRDNTNSTLADLRAGRATELPWLIGAMVRRAGPAGIDVPVARTLLGLLEGLQHSGVLSRR